MSAKSIDEQIDELLAALQVEDYPRAASLARSLADDAPDSPLIRALTALADADADGEAALEAAREAAEESPMDARAHWVVASAAWRVKRLTLAQAAFESAIRFSDRDPAYLAEYAWFLAVERGPRMAEAAARAATLAGPDRVRAWTALGLAQLRLHQRTEAQQSLARALQCSPRDVTAQSTMLLLLEDQGSSPKAAALARLLEEYPQAQNLLASVRDTEKSRRIEALLVERGVGDSASEWRPVRLLAWWMVIVAAGLASILFWLFPDDPWAILLCVIIPLFFAVRFFRS